MKMINNRVVRKKSIEMHRKEYRKNWCMIHEDKRYSTKREQKEKMELKKACRQEDDLLTCL